MVEPFLGENFIFIDLIPVIPKENLKKDKQMKEYVKIAEIAENYRKRFICVVELQCLIINNNKKIPFALLHLVSVYRIQLLLWTAHIKPIGY